MFAKIAILAFVAVSIANAQYGKHHGHSGESYNNVHLSQGPAHEVVYHTHPKYEYKYGISDSHTHDNHEQHESRDGDVVKGEYSLHEADGTIRTVKYTADHKNGFNAQVIRSGHAQHPESHEQSKFAVFAQHGHGDLGGQDAYYKN